MQWEMSQGGKKKDISYLCIFVWHEELFTMGPAPSIATLLPAAPTLVLTHSQHCRPSRSHTGFGKVWKGSGAEQPPPPIPYRKRKEHEFFLLKIFFKQTNSPLFFACLFPSWWRHGVEIRVSKIVFSFAKAGNTTQENVVFEREQSGFVCSGMLVFLLFGS